MELHPLRVYQPGPTENYKYSESERALFLLICYFFLKIIENGTQAGPAFQTHLHKQRLHRDNNIFLHVSTDQAVVGSQGRIVKTPVVQVILSGVEVPACGQI